MSLERTLADVIVELERAAVPYMITGSIASSYYGEPRSTRDIDVVIDPDRASLDRLIAGLRGAGFYVDRDAALVALRDRSQVNAIGPDAMKVDLIIRKERPFSVEEFARRQRADLLGTPGYLASAEDVVLAKLEWAVATDSDRQMRDAAAILAIDGGLDLGYIDRWADALGVAAAWQEIQTAIG